jgi:hypothetical protein
MKVKDLKTGNEYVLSQRDEDYIRSQFIETGELSSRLAVEKEQLLREISEGRFPKPTYSTDEGDFFPPYYVNVMKAASRNVQDLREYFLVNARKLLRVEMKNRANTVTDQELEDEVEQMWFDFLSGEYGACLIKPEPASIIKKDHLLHEIDEMLAHPRETDMEWRNKLCTMVSELDRIEAAFAEYDRIRFNSPTSRDMHIDSLREKYCG